MPHTSTGCPLSRFSSCSPSRIGFIVVLTATWGVYGFKPTLYQTLPSRLTSEYVTSTTAGLHTQPAAAANTAAAAVAAQPAYSRGRQRCHNGGIVAHSSSSSIESTGVDSFDGKTDHVTAAAVERPWLGNGADPMAAARKNLPSSLVAAEEAGAGAQTAAGGKGKGVLTEEMWLSGPFMAPLPPAPVVRVTMAADATNDVEGWVQARTIGRFYCCNERSAILSLDVVAECCADASSALL